MATSIVKATSIDLLTTSANNLTAAVTITGIATKVNTALASGNFHDVVEMGIELSLTNIDVAPTGIFKIQGEMVYGDGSPSDDGRIDLYPGITFTGTSARTFNVPLRADAISPATDMNLYIFDDGAALDCDLAVVAAVKAVVSS
jgi:hypothetical protein